MSYSRLLGHIPTGKHIKLGKESIDAWPSHLSDLRPGHPWIGPRGKKRGVDGKSRRSLGNIKIIIDSNGSMSLS